ncbi:MAG TPA: protein translocase subunit SecD [Candidatus Macondimonas sp.]|nr:protein translocase subunit SecD [Candidatus Macondimonas sp.]
MNRYSWWKNALILLVLLVACLYALPNLFGEDPSIQITGARNAPVSAETVQRIEQVLRDNQISPRRIEFQDGRVLVRYLDTETQLLAREKLAAALGNDHVLALNIAPRTPAWLLAIGARPMNLGLDLRGGVHFLLEVDMKAAVNQRLERYEADLRRGLREIDIRYAKIERHGDSITVTLREAADRSKAMEALRKTYPELAIAAAPDQADGFILQLSETEQETLRSAALQQNLNTLRNRINELGVAEPLIQQQGRDRIVVQLPGVQDTARAKEILGATATLEFRLVDMDTDAAQAARTGQIPATSKLYKTREGYPVLLKREVIVTGDQLVSASSGFDGRSGGPSVNVTLDSRGAGRMGDVTRTNLGRQMAVVFVENRTDLRTENGQTVRVRRTVEEVVSVATIQGIFSKNFQITGLDQQEARDLALLLRAGALAAPVDIVEERTVGPSLGQQNIEQGWNAAVLGFLLVVIVVGAYYKVFGLIANLALLFNVIILVALMSILQATLTLPGIAGIVLTMGMAVDANVLIFERIREELRNGSTPQAAIYAGYEKAFATIADSNITTIIAAALLFGLGSGPVRGFAVTLSLGIMASMFTAITGTRALVNLIYGNRRVTSLSI